MSGNPHTHTQNETNLLWGLAYALYVCIVHV